ncbi:MAG: hypothetical protein NVSMB38_43360 [Ktedonobacteraceae bacterium]
MNVNDVDVGKKSVESPFQFLNSTSLGRTLADFPSASSVHELRQRERRLGVGTISAKGMQILHDQLTTKDIPWSVFQHRPSLTAREKQAILVEHEGAPLVNKTVTALLGSRILVLITGVGDFQLERRQLHHLGKQLGLSSKERKWVTLNPPWFHPEEQLQLLTGMVSPFFLVEGNKISPGVQALALLSCSEEGQANEKLVALSLSLHESLLIPKWSFQPLVHGYAQQAYPFLPLLMLHRM